MIRKLVFFIILIFVTFWFAGAYLIKHKIISTVQKLESDNIKVEYDELIVSGFPRMWTLEMISPQVKLIDHTSVHEFHIPKLLFLLDFSFKKMKLLLGQDFKHEHVIKDQIKKHTIHAANNVTVTLKLVQPLYLLSDQENLNHIIKSFALDNTSLMVANDDKEIFAIQDLAIFIANNLLADSDDTLLRLKGAYQRQDETISFNSAIIDLNVLCKFIKNNSNNTLYDKGFTVNNLYIEFDDAKVNLHGTMNLTKGKLPQGKFFINLNNYDNAVDKLVPDNFIISRSLFKKFITKAINNIDINDASSAVQQHDAQFDITFSEKGISIGSMNLLDLKTGN